MLKSRLDRFLSVTLYIAVLKGKETEIQPGLEPGSSELQSDALTTELLELWHWSRDRHNSIPAGSQVYRLLLCRAPILGVWYRSTHAVSSRTGQ